MAFVLQSQDCVRSRGVTFLALVAARPCQRLRRCQPNPYACKSPWPDGGCNDINVLKIQGFLVQKFLHGGQQASSLAVGACTRRKGNAPYFSARPQGKRSLIPRGIKGK